MPSESIFRAMCIMVWNSISRLKSSLLICIASKTWFYIAGTSAVFSMFISVCLKQFPAAFAIVIVNRFFADFVTVAVPPVHSAFVWAEYFCSRSSRLNNRLSAALANRRNTAVCGILKPPVKWFHCVYRQIKPLGYVWINRTVCAKLNNSRFLFSCHIDTSNFFMCL